MTTLFVASGGGHLQELAMLAPRFGLTGRSVWVTPKSSHLNSKLSGQEVVHLPYYPPRSKRGTVSLAAVAESVVRKYQADRIITTGALPAPPFLWVGSLRRLDLHYIESVTRIEGPSLAGKLAARIPSVNLYSQHARWAAGRWSYGGNVFDAFTAVPADRRARTPRRFVVTLGTESFGFRRALESVVRILPRDSEVLWQTGSTDVSGLGIRARAVVPNAELRQAIATADVVISHAGAGSAATAFELGKAPVLLPRAADFGEHVDDHQSHICGDLAARGLAVACDVTDLAQDHLLEAAGRRVLQAAVERPFPLRIRDGSRSVRGHHGRAKSALPASHATSA